MRIQLSGSFTDPATRDTVTALVRFGFADTDHRGIEVHVKARTPDVTYIVPGTDTEDHWPTRVARRARADHLAAARGVEVIREVTQRHRSCSGYAYDGVPGIARVARDTRNLVTMHIPLAADGTLVAAARSVVFVAAHEAKHVEDFRGRPGGRTSERSADAYGNTRARRWEESQGIA